MIADSKRETVVPFTVGCSHGSGVWPDKAHPAAFLAYRHPDLVGVGVRRRTDRRRLAGFPQWFAVEGRHALDELVIAARHHLSGSVTALHVQRLRRLPLAYEPRD